MIVKWVLILSKEICFEPYKEVELANGEIWGNQVLLFVQIADSEEISNEFIDEAVTKWTFGNNRGAGCFHKFNSTHLIEYGLKSVSLMVIESRMREKEKYSMTKFIYVPRK